MFAPGRDRYGPRDGDERDGHMRARTTIIALAMGLTLITGGTATATTGAAGSGVSGAVQYAPEDTGSVPLAPPETPPVTETTPPLRLLYCRSRVPIPWP